MLLFLSNHARVSYTKLRVRCRKDTRGLCRRKMFVLLSVTRRYCIETAKPILKLFWPSGSQHHHSSFLWFRALVHNSKRTPSAGVQNTWGWEILRFSTQIAVYLRNGAR